jgi:UDP-N-acetylmuramoyl-L-alanyl-D-glutamate--2,6-diaminopimelate ligase
MGLVRILRSLLPNWLVNYFFHLPLAMAAIVFYGYPARNLIVIGVTGTDGKTTTATLIWEILRQAGKKVALITTVGAKIGEQEIDTGFHVTTPESWQLQKLIRKIVNRRFEYLVLETTSNGLAQFRLLGCNFYIGVVTNITDDHLDYHGTWENYALAKAVLLKNAKIAVLDRDDKKSYEFLKKILPKEKIITYGLNKSQVTLKVFPFKTHLIGEYNQLNCLAAIAVTKALGIKKKDILKGIFRFKGVIGRMEVMLDYPFKVVVDFAHTPNALEQVLKTLKRSLPKNGRLIAVFGCAGDRDKQRRRMGEISAKLADITIITAEDPRLEGVESISNDISTWAKKGGAYQIDEGKIFKISHPAKHYFICLPDREEAIKFAIQKLARKSDIIGIFGKGHEKSMCFGVREYPWSDQEVVKKYLKGGKYE